MTTTIQGTLRVTHFSGGHQVTILNCEHAGKRGKICERISVSVGPTMDWSNRAQLICDLLYNLPIQVKSLKCWADALAFAEHAKSLGYEIYNWEEKAIRVAPLDFEKIILGNDKFGASCDYESFGASCRVDRNNEPTWISTSNQKKSDFKKVYDFMKKNKEMLSAPDITLSKFMSLVKEHTGVYGHYYCAMD